MTIDRSPSNASTYLLGHADVEIRRLILQAQLYDGYTEHALHLAGLRPGMRVLDVGCGPGDVSFAAARLVGPEGQVLGIDAADGVIELARTRAAEHGLNSARLEQTTIGDLHLDEPVDAVVGRLILMHLPDPVATLRQMSGLIRPGGVIAFSEYDMTAARGVPSSPLWEATGEIILKIFTAMGLDTAFAATLPGLYHRAGLSAPRLALGQPVGGADHPEVLAFLVDTLQSLRPTADELGVAMDAVGDLDTLPDRIRQEIAASGAIVTTPALITAWSHV
ncbi:class I SAM-dependent methyltransferase [Mycobacterium shigaense]|uniref:class I SAM-dependent methyltransferase n=1 Tax=Mycobacterium shigaense TaxID=722731 RepID=UPI002AE0118B|nr:class I SAM-dependent methyltransferase [Mycobacterium shigaense]MEA1122020.1 class I SAM-dependent methyltransferase [Mycobacterium shigaense]